MAKRNMDSVVTIKDIAASCGVSISTVSNVLNGKKNKVSEEMAAKIRAEVERTGYRPNYLAKSLRAISTKTIGIIAEDLIVFSAPPIIEGVMNCCEEHGYNVVIENMRLFGRWSGRWMHDEALFQSALQPVLAKMDAMNVDGILYVGGHEHTVSKLTSVNNLPIVMSYAIAADKEIPTFRLDDVSGGYDVTKYLVSKGHKRIGVIAGEYDNTHTVNRIIGIQKAMFEEGILFDPSLVEYCTWNKAGGYKGMKALIDKDITAVFCMSDSIASGAYAFLKEKGLEPGLDISVMGYDNQEISSFLNPEVTTMALPLEEIGYKAADKIIEMINDPFSVDKEKTDIRIKSTLVERQSVKTI
ncbi:MAG: LacI family DNA-binding transcriptional regulator [Lachnospiraceae bacterium]|nr:LacI family DNA-binding transcriptional regulator [Lachnospiraceae bacterium]